MYFFSSPPLSLQISTIRTILLALTPGHVGYDTERLTTSDTDMPLVHCAWADVERCRAGIRAPKASVVSMRVVRTTP